ncbi:MAG: ketoacyl-ACP synthase III [Phycisphaerales bacterium]|nr:ketoacyl-ACP synthase III [Phycisphaerales bacterium]
MKIKTPVVIRGTGSYAPEDVVTNDFFASYLDTSDEWITQRSGIKRRHRAGPKESSSTMGAEAARRAIANAGLSPNDIDLILLATATPDVPIPSTACLMQHELGITNVPALDLSAACAGLIYGLIIGGNMIASGGHENVLVVGSETLTRYMDMEDRSTCVLFGDGAGAVVLGRSPDPDRGFLYTHFGADGSLWRMIWVPAGGSREPTSMRTVNEKLHYIRMMGRDVFKVVVTKMEQLIDEALAATGLHPDQLTLVLPHQSNLRIIESFRRRLDLPADKVAVNIHEYGNTSAASIGLALDEARRTGRVKEGDLVLMVAFGAGVTWGTIVARL